MPPPPPPQVCVFIEDLNEEVYFNSLFEMACLEDKATTERFVLPWNSLSARLVVFLCRVPLLKACLPTLKALWRSFTLVLCDPRPLPLILIPYLPPPPSARQAAVQQIHSKPADSWADFYQTASWFNAIFVLHIEQCKDVEERWVGSADQIHTHGVSMFQKYMCDYVGILRSN